MWTLLFVFSIFVTSSVQSDEQALQRMVATERAFAAATAEIGVRDGFLSFFASDAIEIEPGAAAGVPIIIGRARDSLVKLPLIKLPLANRLMWEPFTGQMAADGQMGWLTGASVTMAQATHDILRKGAYFSVWKRQSDGSWRVWLDEGISLPAVWQDASPFRAAPDPDAGAAGRANEPIAEAEQSVASNGAAWQARLAAHVRVHRDDHMPLVDRDAVVAWAAGDWTGVRYTLARTELAGSGELAVTMGSYDRANERGTWVRVWKRDVTSRWRIVFETSKMAR